jgi:HlyD family secretion protein
MNRKTSLLVGVMVVVLLVVGAVWYLKTQAASADTALRVSGTIEADNIAVAAEVPGRIVTLNVDEGAEVQAGETLAQLDTALVDGQIAQAQAALELAQANLAQVNAGARAEQIRAAEGAVAQALAARDGAQQAWLDTQKARDHPQELDAQIDAARAALAVAEAQLKQAVALAGSADEGRQEAQHIFDLVGEPSSYSVGTPWGLVSGSINPSAQMKQAVNSQLGLAGAQDWVAWTGVQAATSQRDGALTNLDNLTAIRANPLEANARVDAAYAQYQAADGALKAAQAKLAALKAGSTKEQIASAESQVAQAQAALKALQVQQSKMTLVAPRAGYVVARLAQRGELATPNVPLLKLADLDDLTMMVYLPTTKLGEVKLGDAAQVSVDGFTDRRFAGKVIFISPQAEFTPTNTQTQDARTQLVYGVKLALANPDHVLKPGMASDVEFSAADGSIVERGKP